MTRAGLNVTLLLAGATASMPVVMVGYMLAQSYGTWPALLAIALGNAVVCAVGFLTAHLALKYRATTSDTVGALGGDLLAQIFGVAMVVSMLGWFTVQCSVLVDFVGGYLPKIPFVAVAGLVGLSLVLAAMGDIKRLFWLSEKLSPVLLLACGGMLVWSLAEPPFVQGTKSTFQFWSALSLVIAVSLGVVIDVPTYYRVLSSKKDAFVSVFLVAFVTPCLVQALGVFFVSQYTEAAIIMSPFGVVLALSGWLMNVNNLYSAVVSSQTLVKRGSLAVRSLLLGGIALVLVCFGVSESLATFIEAITIGISSMGGVMAACVLVPQRNFPALAFAFACGVLGGALSLSLVLPLTGAAQIDAFLTAGSVATFSLLGVQLWRLPSLTKNN